MAPHSNAWSPSSTLEGCVPAFHQHKVPASAGFAPSGALAPSGAHATSVAFNDLAAIRRALDADAQSRRPGVAYRMRRLALAATVTGRFWVQSMLSVRLLSARSALAPRTSGIEPSYAGQTLAMFGHGTAQLFGSLDRFADFASASYPRSKGARSISASCGFGTLSLLFDLACRACASVLGSLRGLGYGPYLPENLSQARRCHLFSRGAA